MATRMDARSSRGQTTLAPTSAERLIDLDGVGEALAERIVKAFGSEAAFFEAARSLEVDRIMRVDGISERKAVDIILRLQGRTPGDFLRTPRAEALYTEILDRIRAFANTAHARNRIALLVPQKSRDAIDRNLGIALDAKKQVADLPRDDLARLLGRITPPRTPRPKYDSGLAILVDRDEDRESLVRAGVDRYCQVLTADDASVDGFDLIIYAYSQGLLDLSGADNIISTHFTDDPGSLVPEATLAWFRENRTLIETAASVAGILGWETRAPGALTQLDAVGSSEVDFTTVEQVIRDEVDAMNAALKQRTSTVALTGDEVYAMMQGERPKKIRDMEIEILRDGRARLREKTGTDWHVFTDAFPLAVDEDSLEKRRQDYVSTAKRDAFRGRVAAGRRLAGEKMELEREIQRILEFDYTFAIGSFCHHYDLHAPKFGEKGWHFEGALHMDLAGNPDGIAIDYSLTQKDRVALLTGANSGGKTTLLETLAQIAILAHMGLPVAAKKASVELVDAVYFFTQKRSLDAGAFESFLKGFLPIVTGNSRKLVLADELEAMTELDAAAKIVGTFIDMLKGSGSSGVCVTHMADEVGRYTSVRIDGIEARGLDENHNLIVDRTPRMNYRARSTPELILRRLENRATGEEREVLKAILAKFESS